MKEQWKKLELRIDALTLRERAMVFAVAVLVLITLINVLLLDPLFAKQKTLSQQVQSEQQQIAAIQAQIQQQLKAQDQDPNLQLRERLRSLKLQSERMRNDLVGMQKGLVSPDKMASLLEDMLKRNNRLQLVSLKTLPVSPLNDSTQNAAATPKSGVAPNASQEENRQDKSTVDAVYKHGVEIVVQGSYPDLTAYLAQLEAMPWQVFWAKAALSVDTYPKSSLTLTLFTLSLDKKWLNI